MNEVLYKRTIRVAPGYSPDLGELQSAANLLGLEVVRVEYDVSGEKTNATWIPRWHVYLEPFAFEAVGPG